MLSTVVKAHDRNKAQKASTLKDFDSLEDARTQVEEETEQYATEKGSLITEIQRRREQIIRLDTDLATVVEGQKRAIQ